MRSQRVTLSELKTSLENSQLDVGRTRGKPGCKLVKGKAPAQREEKSSRQREENSNRQRKKPFLVEKVGGACYRQNALHPTHP